MASVYSVRMGLGTVAAAGYVVVYTCPASKTAVVRDVEVTPVTGAVTTVGLDINGTAVVLSYAGGPSYVTLRWQGRIVLHPGDTLKMFSVGGDSHYCISGYELG